MLSRQSETGSLTCEGMQAEWLSRNIIKLYIQVNVEWDKSLLIVLEETLQKKTIAVKV